MHEIAQQFKKYFAKPESYTFPQRITVELTNRCNLNCAMCPRHLLAANLGDMDWDLYKKIIDEASEHLPVALVPFFRGEPLLHPQFLRMVRYAKEKGLGPIQLATNALLLNEELSIELINLDLDFISFSLNSIDFSNETNIEGSDPFNVKEKVENFIDLRDRLKLDKPTIQVSLVETEESQKGIKQYADEWIAKVDRVRVYEEHSKDGQFGSLISLQGEEEERKPCLKVLTDMVIYWDGEVALCNHDWFRKDRMGNAKEKSIQEIWQNAKYHQIRTMHYQGKAESDLSCQGCDHWIVYYKPEKMIGKLYSKEKL